MLVSSDFYVSITSPSFIALHLPVSEIGIHALPEGVYFFFTLNVHPLILSYYFGVFIEKHVYTEFHLDW